MTATHGFSIFPTAIGTCGIAWSPRGIAGAQLPEAEDDAAATLARMAARFPAGEEALPPPWVQAVIDALVAVLAGTSKDLLLRLRWMTRAFRPSIGASTTSRAASRPAKRALMARWPRPWAARAWRGRSARR